MSQSACPTPEELSRQLSLGPDETFSLHMSGCSKCAQAFESESSLIGMFRALPWGDVPAAQVSGARAALLQQASLSKAAPTSPLRTPRLPWARLALAAVVLLAVGAALYLRPPAQQEVNPPTLTLAKVEAAANSQYSFEGPKDNEIVLLRSGTVTVQVSHLTPGERFRVITGDAEVEVRGTKFSVTAKDNQLVKVEVFEGKVEVRPANGAKTLLLPSQAWDVETALTPATLASSQPATLAVLHEAPKEPAKEPKTRPELSKSEPAKPKSGRSPSEEAFEEGLALMNDSSFEKAAESFLQAATLDPSQAIVEDARFWYASALNRAGKKGQAQKAYTSFLAKYPNYPRRGEAAISLGRILLDSGDLDGAQIMFESAQDDPVVQKSARDGLATIAKRRAQTPTPP